MDRWNYILKFEIRSFLKGFMLFKKEKRADFSQRSYARFLGFTCTTFNEIISGKRKITDKSFQKLQDVLKKDEDFEVFLKNDKLQKGSIPEKGQMAFKQLVEYSPLAKANAPDSLYCVLIVAKDPKSLEQAQGEILGVLKEVCSFQDLHELTFTCTNSFPGSD